MERHENGAHQVADDETEDRPPKGKGEYSHGKSARHDREQHEIRAKPNREKIPGRAVSLVEWDRPDRADFEVCRLVAVFHGIVFWDPSGVESESKHTSRAALSNAAQVL
jgi:hypothetical protein